MYDYFNLLFVMCYFLFHYLFSGSVSSCDAFLNVFQSHGLKPEAICPCATSPEALTVAIRRYNICIPTHSGKRGSDTVWPAHNNICFSHNAHH